MYKYKVSGNMHLWGFINLTDALNCRILDYSVTDNQVNYVIYGSKDKWD